MKNVVRVLALSLVVTGALVSNHVNSGLSVSSVSPRTSALPVPTCPPDDPKGCGICAYSGRCTQ